MSAWFRFVELLPFATLALLALLACENGGPQNGPDANHQSADAALLDSAYAELVPMDANPDVPALDSTSLDLAEVRDFTTVLEELQTSVDSHYSNESFTLRLANAQGVFFNHSIGDSSENTRYESASTSKLITSTIILDVVENSALGLASHPQEFLDMWTADSADFRSRITLRHLLSFTSGLQSPSNDPFCLSNPSATMPTCVFNIYTSAADNTYEPGNEFIYGGVHLQVAGLMAIRAAESAVGESNWTWQEMFSAFKNKHPELLANSSYDLPSSDNPRLAGGMHWTAADYVDFLGRLATGELLSAASLAQLQTDHTSQASVNITYSPADAISELWHYGLGCWRECHAENWQPSCDQLGTISSPGSYGAYPFIDFSRNYWGILARQGSLGSFEQGYAIFTELRPLVEELAELAP